MRKWQSGLLGCLTIVGMAALLAFGGCEGTTDEDNSGVAAYLAAHPYSPADRDAPLAPELKISPIHATVANIGQTVAFTVSGGIGAYHWGVSDAAIGAVESGSGNAAIYICLAVGNNDVIVQDDGGHYAAAHVSPVSADTITVSPSSVTLASGALNTSFSVSGGTAPYSWTSGNTKLGTVAYSAASSYVAAYTAVAAAYGENVVTVIDANGRTASATVKQEP